MQIKNTVKNLTAVLVYAAIGFLFLNLLFIFLPAIEVYQPSQKETVLRITTYSGWYTSHASMLTFIFPIFSTFLPYICSVVRLRGGKSVFMKLIDGTVAKPIHFFWLKFGALFNLIFMFIFFQELNGEASRYAAHGAYCRLTVWGILNIICTVLFIMILFVLSFWSKSMLAAEKKENNDTTESTNDNESILEESKE